MDNVKFERTKLVLLILLIYILVFQNFLQQYIEYFKFFDEGLAILSIPIIIIYDKSNIIEYNLNDI